jgi:hypothetical protein
MPFNDNLPAENTDPWYTPLVAAWANLKTFVNGLETAIGTKVNSSTYVAGLAGKADLVGGVIPTSQLPPLAINDTFTVASQAAMLALTAQVGDVAIRTDTSNTYILSAEPATTLGNWKALLSPGTVVSVAGKTGVVSLVKADVGLGAVDNTSDVNKPISSATQTALNGKASTGDLDNVFTLANTKVTGLNGVTGLWKGTAAEYAAIATPSPTVVYIVTG